MREFIINNYSYITLCSEILAAVTGLVLFKKYKHTVAKYFIYFLVYIIIMVIIGRYSYLVQNDGVLSFLKGTLLERNYWWFTIFWKITAPVFFGWYYFRILKNKRSKQILKFSILTYLFISILAILITLPRLFITSIPIIQILGGIIILECVYFYFTEILKSDKVLTFYKSLNFYISCSILIFWLVKTPIVFYEQYYRQTDMDYVTLRAYINLFAVSCMYLTYTIGLIVSKPEYD